MFSILVVDDEIYTVQGILSAMPWEHLEIGPVYTAYSIFQAKEIFNNHSVDILLCDIEMPQGSGLELLAWVNKKSPKTIRILLTCHADFSYAQQAVKLQCHDYLLKPVPYEKLEKVMIEAVAKIKQSLSVETYTQFGQLWENNSRIIESKFWFDLIDGRLKSDRENIIREAEKLNIKINYDKKFIPILISLKEMNEGLESWSEEVVAYSISNLAIETLNLSPDGIPLIQISSYKYLIIFDDSNHMKYHILANKKYKDAIDSNIEDSILEKCQVLLSHYQRYLGSQFVCYSGEWVSIEELRSEVNLLIEIDILNIAYFNEIISRDNQLLSDDEPEVFDFQHWNDLLRSGNTGKIYQEAMRYLDQITDRRQMSAQIMQRFFQDFTQIIYIYFSQLGVSTIQLNRAANISEESPLTINKYKIRLKQILELVEQQSEMITNSKTLVNQVKEYIQQNLNNGLTCEEISDHFFLHSDHLTRVLKKETGHSLSDIIVREKIAAASELLSRSSISISQIANQVGYTNVSHFIRMFKRITGESPSVYRKNIKNRKIQD
jgi:two-component system response regulator YesN